VVRRISVRRRDRIKGRVLRNVVPRHELFHVARVLVYVVAVVFGIGLLPLRVFLIELVLVIWRKLALPASGVAAVTIVIAIVISTIVIPWGSILLRRHLSVRGVRWNGVLTHQILHVTFHADHVVAIVRLTILQPA